MPWRALTENDVLSGMTSREVPNLGQTGGVSDDRLPGILELLTSEIRGMIATHRSNQLDSDEDKIPVSFIARAAIIARWRLMASIPNYTPSESRKLEYEKAEDFFKRVAKGEIRPEAPDNPIENTVPDPKPGAGASYWAAGSRTGRTRMDGL